MTRQRDLLPLPLLEPSDGLGKAGPQSRAGLSTGAFRRGVRRLENFSMVNEVVNAVNSLAGFREPKA